MSIEFKEYLIDFADGTQDYLAAEDLEEVFEWIKKYSSNDEVLGIYKRIWEQTNEQ
jgi:hypothetical protein